VRQRRSPAYRGRLPESPQSISEPSRPGRVVSSRSAFGKRMQQNGHLGVAKVDLVSAPMLQAAPVTSADYLRAVAGSWY
jgi:hypothetical protein